MEKDGALLVVAEAYCRYKSPAFYEDDLIIRTKVSDLRSRSLRFIYEVYRPSDETLLAEEKRFISLPIQTKKSALSPKPTKKSCSPTKFPMISFSC
jgi:acyl-CoA thioester hydrolase